jgi:asparagine synthase (glutamine-hydrolysing)
MCGIAGIFHYRHPERAVDLGALTRMTRALAHRGPDGEGFHTEPGLGLGHRRLAILDLSPTGAQPMTDGSSRRWIVYNGELYNHREFRPALSHKGHSSKRPEGSSPWLTGTGTPARSPWPETPSV